MNTPRRHRIWPYILAILVGICLLPVIIVASHLGLNRDASVLRDGMKLASGSEWSTRIQFSSGFLAIPTARVVLAFCDVDEEAKIALAALKSASVGVYELAGHAAKSADFGKTLAALDTEMARKGWVRMVAVFEGKENVLVYTDDRDRNSDSIRVCVGVIDGENLVIASAVIRPDALMPIIEKHLPRGELRS